MPHLWGAMYFLRAKPSGEEGGAVVEFRRSYEETLFSGVQTLFKSSFWHC